MNGMITQVEFTSDLCEFIGDGCIGYCGTGYFFQMTGHAQLDRTYYERRLIPILLQFIPGLRFRLFTQENTLRLTVYSKALVMFLHGLGFPLGKKATTVRIPEHVLSPAAVRGLFDTDGYVFFDKRPTYRKPYLRIGIHLQNPGLIEQVYDYLNTRGISATITTRKTKVQLNGPAVQNFLVQIGFSNPRHLSKLEETFKRDSEDTSGIASVAQQ